MSRDEGRSHCAHTSDPGTTVDAVASYAGLDPGAGFHPPGEVWGLSTIAETFLAAVLARIATLRGLVDPYTRCHTKASWLASFALIIWVLRATSTDARVVRFAEA